MCHISYCLSELLFEKVLLKVGSSYFIKNPSSPKVLFKWIYCLSEFRSSEFLLYAQIQGIAFGAEKLIGATTVLTHVWIVLIAIISVIPSYMSFWHLPEFFEKFWLFCRIWLWVSWKFWQKAWYEFLKKANPQEYMQGFFSRRTKAPSSPIFRIFEFSKKNWLSFSKIKGVFQKL